MQSDPPAAREGARAAVSIEGVVEAHDAAYGLAWLKARGGTLIAPATEAVVGERRRIRVIAGDVSLARVPPAASSILNVLAARIVAARAVGPHEMVAVLALGPDGDGARLLARLTRKSWEELAFAEGMSVYAQVKAVALGPGRGEVG